METMLWRCWCDKVRVKGSDRGFLELIMEERLGTRTAVWLQVVGMVQGMEAVIDLMVVVTRWRWTRW